MYDNFRIVKFYSGRYGYKSWYELQRYNPVYKHWYCEQGAIEMLSIKNYCLLHKISYEPIPHFYQNKKGELSPLTIENL